MLGPQVSNSEISNHVGAITYNLLDEEWIPALYRNGDWKRVGIRKALEDADRIRQIAASNPMDRVAILRFLLAVLYWCKGNPPEQAEAIALQSFPPDWFSKLDDNRDCFNLLGDGKRFYQDRTARRQRAATDLLQEIPTGNNFWHFRHSTDKVNALCLPCCMLGLLRLPLFSVSGLAGRSKSDYLKAGINGVPPVYVVPWGMSLLETLAANWAPSEDLGDPSWVQPDVCPTPGEIVPLLTGLTLLSRRVWLDDPEPSGACVACGAAGTPLIRTCEFQTAGKQENELWTDPHVIYSDTKPRRTSRAQDLTAAGKFRMDKPWPDLLARIIETGKLSCRGKPTSLLIVGFATDNAKNIDVWERTIEVPLDSTIRGASASLLARWQKEAFNLTRATLPRNDKASKRKHAEIPPALASIRPHVESRVSAKLRELLAGGDTAWQEAAKEYGPMMDAIAQSLSPGFTTAAVQWRNQIASAIPDMGPKTKTAQKQGRKKGGVK
jgi:hypothetical protein